jgi:hypothetical protein
MGKNTFLEILERQGCVGISIMNAIGDKGEPKIVLVGITKEGKIMASSLSNSLTGDEPSYTDDTFPCKPFCPTEE